VGNSRELLDKAAPLQTDPTLPAPLLELLELLGLLELLTSLRRVQQAHLDRLAFVGCQGERLQGGF
jgi:hypothetical protein